MRITTDSQRLRLEAEMILKSLPDLCRADDLDLYQVRRVARCLVHDEDILGEPPQKRIRAYEEAMKAIRAEQKADDPDYPESARQQDREANEKIARLLAKWRGGDQEDRNEGEMADAE